MYFKVLVHLNMQKAVYINRATKEVYTIAGVKNLEQAWNLAAFVCSRNNWNLNMFCYDVTVKVKSI